MGRGPRGILCTRGEKSHTSKRASVIVLDNAISKRSVRRVRALVRTCQETSKIHQILAVLGEVKYQILTF